MKILFVGINPHPGSAAREVPYSNNKMFWYLLSAAGIIDEPREKLRNDAELKKIYMHAFKKKYHLGLISMVDRPTRTVTELKKREGDFGRKRLIAAIKRYHPPVVCFVGKAAYKLFKDTSDCHFGWQKLIDGSKIYVMHAPHHGPARVRVADLKKVKAALSS